MNSETKPEAVRRLNDIGLVEEGAAALDAIRERTGFNTADTVNRALQLYDEWEKQQCAGHKWVLHKSDGTMQSLHSS